MLDNLTNINFINDLHRADELAFKKIYNLFHQAILSNIVKLIHNECEAEDILQEVFIALWNNRLKLTQEHSVDGWLFTTSFYKSLEHLKKAVKHSFIPFTDNLNEVFTLKDDAYDFEANYSQKLSALNTAIESLPRQKKMAFKLCRLEGKTYEEIAETLNISVESAREYVKSASKLLRQHIKVKNWQHFLLMFMY